ncbi:response regulator transcription factor [Halosquirtibacter xylanolyticus]|uniref:response regulator transcription factor n=1 Tax=Halosquirtibacter xylanolyticus TaxID=3374599 RepID=UPI003748376F|nr:response regulator transcription factor [Prolixibacteraceae bacterium]
MSDKSRIFFLEDDLSFGTVLKSYLEINNYDVTWVNDGALAVDTFKKSHYDLCILDVMLPNVDGFSVGKEIRLINKDIPLIYLTAKAMKEDILQGYHVGADDYITKPFDTEVLICKVQAILSRKGNKEEEQQEEYRIGTVSFSPITRVIKSGNTTKQLSPKEAALLELLCQHKNKLLTRETALKKIWGEDDYFTARSMDVFITKLRKYMKLDPNIEIKNIHGSGFIMTDGPDLSSY